ncbi:hypothetical protein [Nocardia paucivorans]|uniref:hypothetical protein n=1 Tax=Nocardia paucivorans TaxID=114259 RepID=UPI0012F9AAC6|nr:hypothetical protein [Nocardia paucivorans]
MRNRRQYERLEVVNDHGNITPRSAEDNAALARVAREVAEAETDHRLIGAARRVAEIAEGLDILR